MQVSCQNPEAYEIVRLAQAVGLGTTLKSLWDKYLRQAGRAALALSPLVVKVYDWKEL